MELGGALRARVQLHSKPDGSWDTGGTIAGEKIRVVRIEDGVRLLDGPLSVRLPGDRLVLAKLSFPDILRVTPKDWRPADWVGRQLGEQDGRLQISGVWQDRRSRM